MCVHVISTYVAWLRFAPRNVGEQCDGFGEMFKGGKLVSKRLCELAQIEQRSFRNEIFVNILCAQQLH